MRHAKKRLQLNRFTSWHKATVLGLLRSLVIYQSIKTTKQRAHAVQPLADKLISLGKKNSLFAKRRAYQLLGDHKLVSHLFNDIAPLFTNRVGGYSRIMLLEKRRGDDAQLAILEFTEIAKKIVKEDAAREEDKIQEAAIVEDSKKEIKPKDGRAIQKEKPTVPQKPTNKFLGGLRNIFKKERDSL